MPSVLDAIRHPLVQAPMAGGPSTPELAAAVSEAGGVGFIASGYVSARDTRDAIDAVRARTSAPFGVNLFLPGERVVDGAAVEGYVERLATESARYGVPVGEPQFHDDDWEAKLELLRSSPVAVVSFTFGCPPERVVRALQDAGSEVWVTVTTAAEARLAVEAGADVLVLQGIEAGGHRGAFLDEGRGEQLGVLVLLRLVAAEVDVPLVAAGGIGDGAALAAVIAAGASAGQLGTAFMLAEEAATHPLHAAALAAAERPTALTRAFSGREARGLLNRFMVEHSEAAPHAYPHLHYATAPLRAAAREQGDVEGLNLWAGQAYPLARRAGAAEVVESLAREARGA